MLNHFRTLLLNLSNNGKASEHIPKDFSEIKLGGPFTEIYRLLFPISSSRLYKLFLVQNYLNLIQAAGLTEEVEAFDPRITYSLDSTEFFKINRYTNPAQSDEDNPIFIYGQYNANNSNGDYYDSFLIEQVGSTQKVTVYSKVRGKYLNGGESYSDAIDAEILLDFTDPNVSKPVKIGNTGVSFSIGNGTAFSATANKTWEFIIEAPYVFNFQTIYQELRDSQAVDRLFKYKPEIEVTKFENLWELHYNPVYKVAGLLIAYIKKLDSTL